MDEKGKGRWWYLVGAAAFAGLLYLSVREYQTYAALAGTVFSPEVWALKVRSYWLLWGLYSVSIVVDCWNFFACMRDDGAEQTQLANAVCFAVISLGWGLLGFVGLAGTMETVLWVAVLAVLVWSAVSYWRKFQKLRRQREME